jgi:hypothetical protein
MDTYIEQYYDGRKRPMEPSPSLALAPLPLYPPSPDGRESRSYMSPTDEQIQSSTETFDECSRLVHSGSTQAGIQYLMRRWRAIPEALQTRFLHGDFLTLPADTQEGIQTLLLVRSREAGIAERTAPLRHQMREHRAQTARLDAAAADINAAFRTRWHRLCAVAALFGLAALLTLLYSAL